MTPHPLLRLTFVSIAVLALDVLVFSMLELGLTASTRLVYTAQAAEAHHRAAALPSQAGGWLPVSNPATLTLKAIDLLSGAEAWAGGGAAGIEEISTFLHYTNGSWQSMSVPPSQLDRTINSIDMTSPSNGWAVGFETAIRHYQGGNWTIYLDNPSESLSAVQMLDETDGWIVGTRFQCCPLVHHGLIRHYVGGAWLMSTQGDKSFYDISMVSPSEGWVVGESGTILRYAGGSWIAASSPTTQTLYAVQMISATEGWAVGNQGALLHYAGGSWQSVTSPTTSTLYALAMISPSAGWAVGQNGTILYYDDNAWLTVSSPTPNTLYGLSLLPTGAGWAVGANGVILYRPMSHPTPSTQVTAPPTGTTVLTSTDGLVRITLAGAFSQAVVVTQTPQLPLEPVPIGAGGVQVSIGFPFELTATLQLNGQPVQPDNPYTITVSYLDSEIQAAGVPESSLRLYSWNGSQWEAESTSLLDASSNMVTAAPNHFSLWALLGETYRLYLPLALRNN